VRHIPTIKATFALEKRKKKKAWNEQMSESGRKEVIEDMLSNPGVNHLNFKILEYAFDRTTTRR
jgi:hypothetical protein